MLEYYSRRAPEYERVYEEPERQEDLWYLRRVLPELFRNVDVLEVACGTGYWTQVIAPATRSVVATDAGENVLAIAREKPVPAHRVRFECCNAFELSRIKGQFSGALAAFWWSHLGREARSRFLAGLHARLADGAIVAFLDDRYLEGVSTRFSRTDDHGNTYQNRKLGDGSEHEVLKNFSTIEELRQIFAACGTDLNLVELTYYWIAWYRLSRPALNGI